MSTKVPSIFKLKSRILATLSIMGYQLSHMKRLNRANPDHEIPLLLYDCYVTLSELETKLETCYIELTLARKAPTP